MNSIIPPSYAQGQFNLPAPGTMLAPSPAFSPVIITGMTIHPENPLQFDFIVDTGDDHVQGESLKQEAQKVVNYFMATLTVPEDEMWVNLSPHEKNRILAEGLSKTEMGRDMLIQDYLLKQLTASLIYPEEKIGKKFWSRIYQMAQEKFGTTEIPTNLFNKVWIVPEEASVYVHDNNVFVNNSHLKVMLEQDYLALEMNKGSTKHGLGDVTKKDLEMIEGISAQVVREVILPAIEKEVNEGKNFANLRQIYNAMILATWYKKKLKNSLLEKIYLNQNKTNGIELEDKTAKEKIYSQYLEAFKKGVYDYIKEDFDPAAQEMIPRKYFSGGLAKPKNVSAQAMLSGDYLRRYRNPKVFVGINAEPLTIGMNNRTVGERDQAMLGDIDRLWDALASERPVISESDKWGIRFYFPNHDLHMYINMYTSGNYNIYVSNMGGNHVVPGYFYQGDAPGAEISIEEEKDKQRLDSEIRKLLVSLRDNKGIDAFLRVGGRNETEKNRLAELKGRYAAATVEDEDGRSTILKELNPLLDKKAEDLSPIEVERIQHLVASLGYEPFYTSERIPLDETPSRPMDRRIYDLQQGDIVYIQYGVMTSDNEVEVRTEYDGFIQQLPSMGSNRVILTNGQEINLNSVREIIIDEGRGGHYKVDSDAGGMAPYFFLEEHRGDLGSRIKFVTVHKDTKKDAKSWMTGEKITVLESPGTQNNGVFMYKRADGSFGDHDMVDINRIYPLGVDSEVAQLKTHQFKKGDRVVLLVNGKLLSGTVHSFYAEAFIGRRMVVQVEDPQDPAKPFIHVKFVNELEGVLIGVKSDFSRSSIRSAFERLYDILHDKVYETEKLKPGVMTEFFRNFEALVSELLKKGGRFDAEDFDVSQLSLEVHRVTGYSLEQIFQGIIGERNSDIQIDPFLFELGTALSSEERAELKKAYREVVFGISLFSGPKMASTGTIPWVVKEDNFARVMGGELPQSDFTIPALLRYFINGTYTFKDRLRLAYKIAKAKEKATLLEVLSDLYEIKDQIVGYSAAALEVAADEYGKRLKAPEDSKTLKIVLGITDDTLSASIDGKRENKHKDKAMLAAPGGIDFNTNNLKLKEQGQHNNIEFSLDNIKNIQPDKINGFLPVIINIMPVTNLPFLLGLSQEEEAEELSNLSL